MHDISVAVITSWLPPFEPPLADCGFEMAYRDRPKVTLAVNDDETLARIYARAVAELQPRAVPGSDGYTEDPLEVALWTLFYEPEDEHGFASAAKVWEVAENLVIVKSDGRACWNLPAEEITFADLLRSGERGLLRGDPRRPYLTLLLPQGGDAFLAAWTGVLLVWQFAGHLLQARDLLSLWRGIRKEDVQDTLENGVEVVERYREGWSQLRGGPPNILMMLERRPWPPDDLRIVLGLETVEHAERLLRLYGFRPNASGEYELSDDDEALILRTLAREGSWGSLDLERDRDAGHRIRALYENGRLPPEDFRHRPRR